MVCSTYYSHSYSRHWTVFLLLLIGQKKGTRYHLFPPLARLNIHRLGEEKKKKGKKHKSNLIRSDLTTRGSRITSGMGEMFHYRMAFGPYRPDIWHLKCNLSGLQLKMFIVSQPWPLYHPLPLSQGAAGAYQFLFFFCSKHVPNSREMIHSELTFYATVYSIALNVRSVLSIQLSAYCPSLKGRLVQECVCEAYSAFSLPAGFSVRSHVWWYMEKCCVRRRRQDLLSPLGRISELIKRSPYE